MNHQDQFLPVLYRLIKYTKLISLFSCISIICLVLFPIFYTRDVLEHLTVWKGLYIAFCVLWVFTYVFCSAVALFSYLRHIYQLDQIMKRHLSTLAIFCIIFSYFTSIILYLKIKRLIEKIDDKTLRSEEKLLS